MGESFCALSADSFLFPVGVESSVVSAMMLPPSIKNVYFISFNVALNSRMSSMLSDTLVDGELILFKQAETIC